MDHFTEIELIVLRIIKTKNLIIFDHKITKTRGE